MGERLYRLGRFCAHRKLWVIGVWVVLVAATVTAGLTLKGPTDDGFSIPGTESQRALDLLEQRFPGTGGASARVVVAAPEGHTLSEQTYSALLTRALTEVGQAPQVRSVSSSATQVSKDGRIAFADIQYAVPVDQVTPQAKAALQAIAAPLQKAGLEIEYSGGVIATSEAAGNSEMYGVLVGFVVLAITFGALVAAGMPLLMALVGVVTALMGLQTLSGFVSLSSTTPTLALMLGLAVGIDYTLFLVSRHRAQLAAGMAVADSVALATATAGGAVVFAGLTVIIALASLSVVGIPFLTAMGLGAAGAVAVAVLLSVTLCPAVLALLGHGLNRGRLPFLRRAREAAAVEAEHHEVHPGVHSEDGDIGWAHPARTMGERWGHVVTARPWVTILLTVMVCGVVALPARHLELGLPDDSTKSVDTTERRAYDLLTEGFGAGFNGPLTLVISTPGAKNAAAAGAEAQARLARVSYVTAVSAPVPNAAGDVAILSITPTSAPGSEATKDLVRQIRQGAADNAGKGVDVYVTGTTAINIDVSTKLAGALPEFLAVIVVLALFLLMLVFRSIAVPVKAIVGFLLSVAASTGLVVWVFQEGHLGGLFGVQNPSPVVSFLPVLLIGILFGLAMDYEVFLVSRIREEFLATNDPLPSIHAGMRHSARVVTAAALIMLGVFGSFVFAGDVIIRAIGLALAFGVAVDAFLVRMTLVPAVLAILGRVAWWLPRPLARVLPDLDIEGAHLSVGPGHDPGVAGGDGTVPRQRGQRVPR